MSLALGVLLAGCGPAPLPPGQPESTGESSLGSEIGTDGDDTDTPEHSDETGEQQPPCDSQGYSACRSPLYSAWLECREACVEPMLTCIDEVCEAGCHAQYTVDAWACKEIYCPGPIEDYESCKHECELQALACAADDCQPHECSYGLYRCIWNDWCGCAELKLDIEWADSCEVQFPGPLFHPTNSVVIIGEQTWWLAASDSTCDDPGVSAAFIGAEYEPDRFILCAEACQAFAEVGLLRVEIGTVPCE